jgi:hypothetical protein
MREVRPEGDYPPLDIPKDCAVRRLRPVAQVARLSALLHRFFATERFSTSPCNGRVWLGASRHRGPTSFFNELALVRYISRLFHFGQVRRGISGLSELFHTDGRESCDDGRRSAACREGLCGPTRHPAAPVEPNDRQSDCPSHSAPQNGARGRFCLLGDVHDVAFDLEDRDSLTKLSMSIDGRLYQIAHSACVDTLWPVWMAPGSVVSWECAPAADVMRTPVCPARPLRDSRAVERRVPSRSAFFFE